MATPHIINADIIPTGPPNEVVTHDAHRTHVIDDKQAQLIEESYLPTPAYRSQSGSDDDLFPTPTEYEEKTLRKVPGTIPWIAWCLCLVEFAERASYYGASTVFANFIRNPLPLESTTGRVVLPPLKAIPGVQEARHENPGALGMGSSMSTVFTLLFKFFAYTFPIFGAWLGDAKWGRYKTILVGVLICGVAHIIQIAGAAPSVLVNHQGAAPFLLSLFILAIGAGIFKPNILPTVIDQYTHQKPYTKIIKKTGEKVIIDPELTVNRICLYFYMAVNTGAMFGIATVYAEKDYGFWLAFLLPGILYFLLPLVLAGTAKRTVRHPPNGTVLSAVASILAMGIRRSKGRVWRADFWENVKPSVLAAQGITTFRGKPIAWTDKLVVETQRTLSACSMFWFFPIWYINDGGLGDIAGSQSNAMDSAGAPNDLLGNFNPITIVLVVPLLTHVVYPGLQKINLMPGRVTRIALGFILAAISSFIGMGLQLIIYNTSPCGNQATMCKIGTSPLSLWAQVPIMSLGAISECLCQVTAYEIAYARSPKNMRALVMAFFLFQNALSSALAQILAPFAKDPYLPWIWLAPAIIMLLLTAEFYRRYRWMNNDEFMVYEEEEENAGSHAAHNQTSFEPDKEKGGAIVTTSGKP